MDQGSATVIAASLAAVLALVSIVSGFLLDGRQRRYLQDLESVRLTADRDQETTAWLRQELHRNAVEFLESSFTISALSSRILGFSKNMGNQRPIDTKRELLAAHEKLKTAQTSLRLLAPASLVQIIEDCHDAHDKLLEYAPALGGQAHPPQGNLPSETDWRDWGNRARAERARFITHVREPLGLDIYEHKIRSYD